MTWFTGGTTPCDNLINIFEGYIDFLEAPISETYGSFHKISSSKETDPHINIKWLLGSITALPHILQDDDRHNFHFMIQKVTKHSHVL